MTLHEAGRFAQLLLKGNPFVLEMLFAKKRDGAIYSTPEWDELINIEFKKSTLTQRYFCILEIVKQIAYINYYHIKGGGRILAVHQKPDQAGAPSAADE